MFTQLFYNKEVISLNGQKNEGNSDRISKRQTNSSHKEKTVKILKGYHIIHHSLKN